MSVSPSAIAFSAIAGQRICPTEITGTSMAARIRRAYGRRQPSGIDIGSITLSMPV